MKSWLRIFMNVSAVLACVYLSVSLYLASNHEASWGWGIAGLYATALVLEEIGKEA